MGLIFWGEFYEVLVGQSESNVLNLTQKPGVKVRISVKIEAQSPSGFDDGIQRAVRENCDQLKFKNRDFGDDYVSVTPVKQFQDDHDYSSRITLQRGSGNVFKQSRKSL